MTTGEILTGLNPCLDHDFGESVSVAAIYDPLGQIVSADLLSEPAIQLQSQQEKRQ
jgi:hypothetical protein